MSKSSKPSTPYGGAPASVSNEEFRDRTVSRLKSIQTHLETAPRSGKLKGKVCVVTGVGSLTGIGRAASLTFAHEGAQHLYLMDFDGTNLPDLKETITKKYPDVKVTIIEADAADDETISGVCKQAIQEEGRLDVFFANAGLGTNRHLFDTSAEQYTHVMRVNALSCFLAIKHASQAMMKANPSRGKQYGGGSIILTASVAGLNSGGGALDYSASKAAVNSMAKTAAYQLMRTDVRVNAICPGLIETGMTAGMFEYARARGTENKVGQLNALGRYGISQEIANVALFLASDESSYVNGQNWAVDGALSSSMPTVAGRWA
ncbi:hypothetical protein CERSUDRAFT_88410 [Gelatoporia subvermispora B]|uniref:NAD(P)-binding protein n=1 Tax=Ceriporiopsis subvermispora (strain B) TaxID=914234 RepID=M2QZU7_CERS8|nr:hypothetical protein CERSUDRAFT_88410 [Gelatoporia subvermispora B]